MSEDKKIRDLYKKLGMSDEGVRYAEDARALSPTRKVSSRTSNVTGKLSQRHNDVLISCESRTAEYYYYVKLMHDENVISICPQPPKRKISYKTRDSKKITVWKTHDVLVFYKDRIVLVEIKHEIKLLELQEKAPELITQEDSGYWISPCCQRDAETLGFEFEVFCPTLLDANFVRNADYLFDYLQIQADEKYLHEIDLINRYLKKQKYCTLAELIKEYSADSVLFAIAHKQVFFDWFNSLLCAPENTMVFALKSYCEVFSNPTISAFAPSALPKTLRIDTAINWEGNVWRVLHMHKDQCTIVNEDHRTATMKINDLQRFFSKGQMKIESSPMQRNEGAEIIHKASPQALKCAIKRFKKLEAFKKGDDTAMSGRTARDWDRKCRNANTLYNNPIIGLLHSNAKRGNRTLKAEINSVKIAEVSIDEDFEVVQAPSVKHAYGKYLNRCKNSSLVAISYSAYAKRIRRRDAYRQKLKREGRKSAYQIQGPQTYNEISTPANGDRAWEIGHIDHTQLDIELISSINNEPLGKPWLTLMIDAHSRVVLAMWLTFLPPSRMSVMMVFRDCVQRWGRLPNKIVLDRGREFTSKYIDKLAIQFKLKLFLRPAAQPRFGSVMERMFGCIDTLFTHQLMGNTKHRQLFRSQSKSHEPRDHALWTPAAYLDLLNEFLFEVFPKIENKSLAEAPSARMQRSLTLSGERSFSFVTYDDDFIASTMIEAPFGSTRKVNKGTVSIENLEYRGEYESINEFNGVHGEVRRDPLNPAIAEIYLEGSWRRLICTNEVLREYSERAIKCSHMELTARLSRSGKKYREFNPELLGLIEKMDMTESKLKQDKLLRAQIVQIDASTPINEEVAEYESYGVIDMGEK